MKIIIAGSSGFIGSHLSNFFAKRGDEVVLLSRTPKAANSYFWDPVAKEVDSRILEESDAVINLCGESIFGRWSERKKEQIRNSRLLPTQFLCHTLQNLKVPPKVYLGASAVGYYGDAPHQVLTESSPAGSDFLADVCKEWEAMSSTLAQKGVRILACRLGIVLGSEGGALRYIEKAFNLGMGGILGDGKQMMSWIAIEDVVLAMQHLITHSSLEGAINFTAPQAVSNKEFTDCIGKVLHRPTLLPAPKFALNMFFGEGAQMFLASVHAYPKKLLDSGFIFRYPELEPALRECLAKN